MTRLVRPAWRRCLWMSTSSLAVFLILAGQALAQQIVVRPVADLVAGDTLNLSDSPVRRPLVPLPEGGWLTVGYMESWAWGEFDKEGGLVRAPGKRWAGGGPGEFRDIRAVFPLDGDTLLVLEPYMATRALRDGSYVDRAFIRTQAVGSTWTLHQGEFWIGGWNPAIEEGIPLLRIGPSGAEEVVVPGVRPLTRGEPILGMPVSWGGDLWIWRYPHGPFRRIDPRTGGVLEVWEPTITQRGRDPWRAFAVSGPDDTVIFRVDPKGEWVVFDGARNEVVRQTIPQDLRPLLIADSRFAQGFVMTEEPVRYPAGIRVYEYQIVW
jgi:hypothetical protein